MSNHLQTSLNIGHGLSVVAILIGLAFGQILGASANPAETLKNE